MAVTEMFPPSAVAPDLASYDVIMVNSSAGKDSQVALDVTVKAADEAGVPRDRIVVFHADLSKPNGSRNVEWEGTRELAKEHAEHYGLRFIAIQREQGDLLDHVLDRHHKLRARGDTTTPAWPSSTARWCTSDHKRGMGRRALTLLASEVECKPARILNVMGFRRQESPARAKKVPLRYDEAASGKGTVRQVWEWCPILDWTVDEVWERIGSISTRHHPAYDAGMPRLSCSLCVLSNKAALVLAAQLRPDLAQEYLAVEREVGHTFRKDLSIADIIAAAHTSPRPERIEDWVA